MGMDGEGVLKMCFKILEWPFNVANLLVKTIIFSSPYVLFFDMDEQLPCQLFSISLTNISEYAQNKISA